MLCEWPGECKPRRPILRTLPVQWTNYSISLGSSWCRFHHHLFESWIWATKLQHHVWPCIASVIPTLADNSRKRAIQMPPHLRQCNSPFVLQPRLMYLWEGRSTWFRPATTSCLPQRATSSHNTKARISWTKDSLVYPVLLGPWTRLLGGIPK